MSELDQAAGEFERRWGFDPRPVIERDFRAGDYDLEGATAYERSFIRAMLTGPRKGPLMPIPECDRAKYGGMNEVLYWEMLEGEDPDDRAIREAHGIGYTDPLEGTACRNGCGLSYGDISAGKIRECEVRTERRAAAITDPEVQAMLDRLPPPPTARERHARGDFRNEAELQVPAHDLMLHAHPHDWPPDVMADLTHEHPHTGPGHMGIEHSHPHRHAPMGSDGQEQQR